MNKKYLILWIFFICFSCQSSLQDKTNKAFYMHSKPIYEIEDTSYLCLNDIGLGNDSIWYCFWHCIDEPLPYQLHKNEYRMSISEPNVGTSFFRMIASDNSAWCYYKFVEPIEPYEEFTVKKYSTIVFILDSITIKNIKQEFDNIFKQAVPKNRQIIGVSKVYSIENGNKVYRYWDNATESQIQADTTIPKIKKIVEILKTKY